MFNYKSIIVLFLRAGYILVQLGSVPTENVYVILLQNIVDISVSVVSFGLVGFIFSFGYDGWNGLIGHGMWISSQSVDMDKAILGKRQKVIRISQF